MPDIDQLSQTVTEAMARLHVPGVAVGILHDGQSQVAGYGVTNIDHPLPVDSRTLFQIGSTTKTVTATAIMRLVETGRLALDAPVRTYLPDLNLASKETADRVTLRHLLAHTGGWAGDIAEDTLRGDDALARTVAQMADLPQITPLGSIFSYNNAGFDLAGRLIEIATGQTYETAVGDLILNPLGMTMSFFFPEDVMTHRFVVGHSVQDERPQVLRPWALPRAANPSGGLISTVEDQLRYAQFHMGDGTAADGHSLLTPESMALMQTPQVSASGGDQCGLSWLLHDYAGARIVAHGGVTYGQVSAFMMVPSRHFTITVLTNANYGGALHREVRAWVLRHYLGLDEPEPVMLDLSRQELESYVGYYAGPELTSDVEVNVDDEGLLVRVILKGGFATKDTPPPPAPPPMHLGFFAPDRWVVRDGPRMGQRGEFLRDDKGNIIWLRLADRLRARQRVDR